LFNIGNPNLTADHATDIGLGLEHVFAGSTPARAAIDLYRTNLRNSAQRFVPSIDCNPPTGPPPPPQSCESFPINIGGAVYQGIEMRFGWSASPSLRAHAAYTVNSAYPTGLPPQFQGGTIVVHEQFNGVPLHSASMSIESDPVRVFSFNAGVRYEGRYNELNRPPFAMLQAGATWRAGRIEIGLQGKNLTNVYDARFALARAGVPYGGIAGPIATDALSLQGRTIVLTLTSRY
jgi:outer membrane cobalamin receptor